MSKIFLLEGEVKLSREDRIRMLHNFNKLRQTIQTIEECQDLWLSDIANLQKLHCDMHQLLEFSSDDGEYWKDWILSENNPKEDKTDGKT